MGETGKIMAGLGTYAGMRVIIVPDMVMVLRSWKERLFSWPWRPFLAEELRPNPNCPGDGEALVSATTIFCTVRTHRALLASLEGKAP